MTAKLMLLVLVSVTLSALAQIALKLGMSTPRLQNSLQTTSWVETALLAAASPAVIAGLVMYGFGAILWLLVLARIDVSQAYPFVGIGFLLTAGFGALFLGEVIGFQRIVGTALIAIGAFLVARS